MSARVQQLQLPELGAALRTRSPFPARAGTAQGRATPKGRAQRGAQPWRGPAPASATAPRRPAGPADGFRRALALVVRFGRGGAR